MLPVELDPPSHRRLTYDLDQNSQLMMESLDSIDEVREKAQLQVAAYQQKSPGTLTPKLKKENSTSEIWCYDGFS